MLRLFQNLSHIIEYLFANNCNETELIKDYFKGKKILYVDVGANVGSYFSFLKKNIKIKKSFLIEPAKKNYDYLKKNFLTNDVVLSQIALSNVLKNKLFYEYNISSVSSFYKIKNNQLYKIDSQYKVKTLTLDIFCKKNKIKKIDFLKIDAEDEDLNVLKGSKNLLKNKKINLIKVELNFHEMRGNKSNAEKIIQLLNHHNYKILSLSKTKFKKNKLSHIDIFFY